MKIKNTISGLLFLAFFLTQIRCSKGGYACQAPPPQFDFIIVDNNGKSLITDANKDSLKIVSSEFPKTTQLKNINVRKADSTVSNLYNYVVYAGGIFTLSNQNNDPTFNVELSGKLLGNLKLKTYLDDTDCSGWMKASEILFNGKKPSISGQYGPFIFKAE